MSRAVVVSGLPATGKTTLAKRLAGDLRIPGYHKDDFKEALMDRVGWKDRALVSLMGAGTFEVLLRILEAHLLAGTDCLLEANFRTESYGRLADLRSQYGARLIEVNCRARPDAILHRLDSRVEAGERHPGHDDETTRKLGPAGLAAYAEEHCLNLPDGCLIVDTTDFESIDYAALLGDLRRRLDGA
jgi:predicted kinase